MRARSLALAAVAVALLAVWWDVASEEREPATRAGPLEVARPAEEVVRLPPGAPGAVREAAAAVEPALHQLDDDEPDPPTPERPGPGQALLWVEVVALETGAAIEGAELGLFPTDDEVEHDWLTSTQADPSRGLDNDFVLTDTNGRGEFIVQAGFGYGLRGEGDNGLGEEAELELEPLGEGEERSVRLALRTAWDLDWHGRVIDGATDLPIAGAEVVAVVKYSAETLDGLHELAHGQSDGDGRVVLRLPAWERALALGRARGYFVGGCRVDEKASSFDAVQSLPLHRTAAVMVLVTDEQERPAPDVEVVLNAGSWAIGKDVFGLEPFEWSRRPVRTAGASSRTCRLHRTCSCPCGRKGGCRRNRRVRPPSSWRRANTAACTGGCAAARPWRPACGSAAEASSVE